MSTENPWKTLSSKVIYKNSWIRLREDQVIRPDGREGIYGVVESHLATAVVALTPDNQIYMIGQYRYPTDMYSWEVVEGGSKEGESPLQAAQRELREEAGLTADEWTQLGTEIHLSNCFSAERAMVFLARGLRETAKEPDPTEVLAIKKLPFAEAVRMARNGEIVDALSLIALERAYIFLNNQ